MVRWAPLRIPLQRRLQTLCTLVVYIFPVLMILFNIFILLLPLLWPFYIAYVIWMSFFDYQTPMRGGRVINALRKLKIWKYFRDYFPAELVVVR